MISMIKPFYLITLMWLLVSCDETTIPATEDKVDDIISFEFSLKNNLSETANRYAVGEEINIQLRVINHSDQSYLYQSTAPIYGLVVSQNGIEVWNVHYGIAFIQVIADQTIAANSSSVINVKWYGTNNLDQALSAGEYRITPSHDLSALGFEIPSPIVFNLN